MLRYPYPDGKSSMRKHIIVQSTKAVAKRLSMLIQEYFNIVLWSDDADKNCQYGANRDRSSVPSNCGMSLPIDITESSPYKMKETLTK
jgi:hypothetical protein